MKLTHSIRFRLMRLIGILVVGTLLVVSGVSYYFSEKYLQESLDQTEQSTVTAAAAHVKTELSTSLIQLEDLASMERVQSGDKGQIQLALNEAQQRIGKFDHIFFASPDGQSINDAGNGSGSFDREYFQKVIQTKKSYISEPYMSRSTQQQTIALTVPVLRSGQLIGVIYGTYSLDKLLPIIKDIKFKQAGYGALLDDSGLYLAHPTRPELVGNMNVKTGEISGELKNKLGSGAGLDPKFMAAFAESTEKGKRVQVEYKSTTGFDQIGFFTPIDLPGGQHWVLFMTTTKADATSEITTLSRTQIGLSILCLLIVLGITFWQSNSFVRPIIRISQVTRDIATGQLKPIKKTIHDNSEFGQLSDNIIAMNDGLRNLVQQIQSQSHQLAASSEELTASAHQSADAANQVAGSITEIAHGAEQQATAANQVMTVTQTMSDKVQEISQAAKDVSTIADSTSQTAEQGRQTVEQTISQMNDVGKVAAATENSITELNKSSQEIREIVTLISNIAGQTNLLALNAAIEAARAGEHGRGFAVVAEEVRKLAEESDQAAQKIGSLIEKNEINMTQVVTATQTSTTGIQTGISLVNGTGETFKNIAGAILNLSNEIKDISASIHQIAAGNQQLVASIKEIDTASKQAAAESQTVSAATEEQSASMEEIASSSQSLAILATDLQAAIEKFQI
ncbi:MAG: methyl-accepting chemotaxis protein [Veillonellales bacterium]